MSTNNYELVDKGLRLLREGLLPFVEKQMTERCGTDWLQSPKVVSILQQQPRSKKKPLHLDTQALLKIIWNNWNEVFRYVLDREERDLVSELRKVRNKKAHDELFNNNDAYRTLDSIERLLIAISAEGVAEIERMKEDVLRQKFEDRVNFDADTAQVSEQLVIESAAILNPQENTNHPIDWEEAERVASEQNQSIDFNLASQLPTQLDVVPPEEPKVEPVLDKEILPTITYSLPKEVTTASKPLGNKKVNKLLTLTICSLFALPFIGVGVKYIEFSRKPKIQAISVKIGILSSPDNYVALSDYLRNQLTPNDFAKFLRGEQIKVVIEGDKKLTYEEAKNRITNRNWDIAFTISPIISVAAKQNNYTFAANMFADKPNYQSGLFVKVNSSIQSIEDLKPTHIIALGEFTSASSFYMPTYDLYGKTLSLDIGHRGMDILDMVKQGKAEVGAAAIGSTVKENDPEIRIIHRSRNIPSAGVYLSPKLSNSDRETIRIVILNAPARIKEQSNYGSGQESDYSYFQKIVSRTEEVLKCANFQSNPVKLFCQGSN